MKKALTIITLLINFLMIVHPAFADTTQNQTYVPLAVSDVTPLLSQSDVIKTGDVEPDKLLNITISLKMRNKDTLKQKIGLAHSQGTYGRVVSDQDLANSYLPDETSHSKVIDFLKSSGLQITKTYNSRMAIQVQGSAQSIENAFNVTLSYYTQNGTEFFANSSEPQLPSDIAGFIESIDGLNNIPLKSSIADSSNGTAAFTPQQIQKAYDFTSAYANHLNGQGVNLAIAAYYSYNQSDISYFLNNFGITATNPISLIPIDGTPQRSKSGSEETTLDIESALSSAPGAQLLVYDGDNSDSTTETDEFTQIVDDGKANIVSYSWGLDESEYTPSQLNAMDSLFLAGAAKGMTFLIASGDDGSSEINYPATDPYVTAVGGTTMSISSSSGQISSEVGWSYSNLTQSGSGGGVSSVFLKPSWQPGTTLANSSYRMIPDVALNADPNTAYSIYYSGSWEQIGGTSVSTPEWAAIFALVDQSRSNNGLGSIGLANPDLYSLASGSVFHDITSGSNGEYSCLPGYDMVTGLGSVDADKLVNALATLQSTTAVDEPVATPSGLTATPVNTTQVNMTWSAVSGANSYKVYRSTSSTGSYTQIANPTTTSFSDTGLTQNTTYYYKVSAVGTSGEGLQSNPVSAVTLQATLQSIAITTPATKLNYNIGDSLDITGLVVTGTYSDGSTEVESITAANVTGFNSTIAATNQVLTITESGQTVTYKVQIVAPVPVGNIPVGTVIFSNGQALDLGYANNPTHAAEVTQDVVSSGEIYIITFAGYVINNSTGAILTNLSVLPAVTYKDASGNVEHFASGDGPEVSTSDNVVATVSASTVGSLVTINITNPVTFVAATQFQVYVNGAATSSKANLGTAMTVYPAQVSGSIVQVEFFNAVGTQIGTTQNVTLK
ncbi:putative Tripeptidyl-peptidase I [Candidatus Desulfosporosinus infrequens]|uniref:Putative Tripeptidyl-peptidase I n=1 Tax=Candidatus Desulfosporosinus infrequens TaxID=2043169 RepID=A0A2U3KUD1_9FIRM|nr:putative Tripeptidyl-peptidase I [Candidatus Desulfosporosinus infrequens]